MMIVDSYQRLKDPYSFYLRYLQTEGSAWSTPRSCKSFPSAHLSEDGNPNSSETWFPAKPIAPTKSKQ